MTPAPKATCPEATCPEVTCPEATSPPQPLPSPTPAPSSLQLPCPAGLPPRPAGRHSISGESALSRPVLSLHHLEAVVGEPRRKSRPPTRRSDTTRPVPTRPGSGPGLLTPVDRRHGSRDCVALRVPRGRSALSRLDYSTFAALRLDAGGAETSPRHEISV